MAASVLTLSCASENSATDDMSHDNILQVTFTKNSWTYLSLTQNKVMGTCAMKDTVAEKAWSKRMDWDIAICNGHIRTNSGTSGQGMGGITVSSRSYDDTDAASATTFATDKDTVTIRTEQ